LACPLGLQGKLAKNAVAVIAGIGDPSFLKKLIALDRSAQPAG
jgi:hypothetical protein